MSWEHWLSDKEIEETSPWEALINRMEPPTERSAYDKICERVVDAYEINTKCRKVEHKDRLHFFLLWWWRNKRYMKDYSSKSSIAKLIKKDHATIIHYVGKTNSVTGKHEEGARKKSMNFDENVKCIKDFLE